MTQLAPEMIMSPNGDKIWYQNNKMHREDGPAVELVVGTKFWYQNGKLHREDGPAIEYANGSKHWCQNGLYHRDDGPAIEYANGDKYWLQNGLYHRDDGPAVERTNGRKCWYQNNQRIDIYYPNFGCNNKTIRNREQALAQLGRKLRPYSHDLYMADIDRLFPE